jgi:two-component sensor histidine kinase
MHATDNVAGNRECQKLPIAIPSTDRELRSFPMVTRELAAQKLIVKSQLRLITQFEDRDAARTQQLEASTQELQRKNGEIAGFLSVISAQRWEKQAILREVYHRVKNNLQVVESLLKMKSRSLTDTTARAAIDTSMQRIRVMGMVHEHLYQTPDLGGVSLAAYLRGLVNVAIAAHPRKPNEVQFDLDVEEVPLALDVAIPFGLLMNELLSNCLEHGFPKGNAGTVHVTVRRTANGVRMVVNDNGIGLPNGFDPVKCTTMGLKLAAGLAHQLGGTLKFASSSGCQVQADFTRLAGHLKSESHGIGQRMVAAKHLLLPIGQQAL